MNSISIHIASSCSQSCGLFQTVNIHCQRDAKRGVVNNQVMDWSFRLDGILHNASQDDTYDTVASNIVSSSLNGYNGKRVSVIFCQPLNLYYYRYLYTFW